MSQSKCQICGRELTEKRLYTFFEGNKVSVCQSCKNLYGDDILIQKQTNNPSEEDKKLENFNVFENRLKEVPVSDNKINETEFSPPEIKLENKQPENGRIIKKFHASGYGWLKKKIDGILKGKDVLVNENSKSTTGFSSQVHEQNNDQIDDNRTMEYCQVCGGRMKEKGIDVLIDGYETRICGYCNNMLIKIRGNQKQVYNLNGECDILNKCQFCGNDYEGEYFDVLINGEKFTVCENCKNQSDLNPRGNKNYKNVPYRHIPKNVKREVWRRDQGRCVDCGSNEKLEYDHIIPFSKGGSNTERNIQLLCESCNRKKHNNI